jgi:hypothetical protein
LGTKARRAIFSIGLLKYQFKNWDWRNFGTGTNGELEHLQDFFSKFYYLNNHL